MVSEIQPGCRIARHAHAHIRAQPGDFDAREVTDEHLSADARQTSFDRMIRIALDTAIAE